MLLRELRERVVEAGIRLVEGGLVSLSAGNLSARDPQTGLIVVKPSGGDYFRLRPRDVLVIDISGKVIEGRGIPSSETKMHLLAYRCREGIHGAVHTHSPIATAWGVAGREIPPVVVGQVLTGGAIPVAPYCRPGSEALGEIVIETMGSGNAVILQNHGVFVLGDTIEMAVAAAFIVEEAATVALNAIALGGPLRTMTPDEFQEMLSGRSIG